MAQWMTYSQASKRIGYTEDALRRFVEDGKIKSRPGWLPWPFGRDMLLCEDVETIRRTMSGGARNWNSGEK